jgi:hypothetical protein
MKAHRTTQVTNKSNVDKKKSKNMTSFSRNWTKGVLPLSATKKNIIAKVKSNNAASDTALWRLILGPCII